MENKDKELKIVKSINEIEKENDNDNDNDREKDSKRFLSMKVVILGTEGQLAQAFQKLTNQTNVNGDLSTNKIIHKKLESIFGSTLKDGSLLPVFSDLQFIYLKREEIDFNEPQKILGLLEKLKPKVVINAAAFTAVDKAETEKVMAYQINALTPIRIAHWCKENNSILIHYSTDYVFDGLGEVAKLEADTTQPLNYYGFTKRASEEGIIQSGCQYLIFRISWVYYEKGNNFVKTMLRLGAEKDELKIVSDQVGYPTYALDVAGSTLKVLANYLVKKERPQEIFHLSSDQFTTNWCEFAEHIFATARAMNFPVRVQKIIPISTSEFPVPAKRPLNSRLNSKKIEKQFDILMPDWKTSLKECLQEIKNAESNKIISQSANTKTITTAVILAGGKGTRLGAETSQVPKPMVEIQGKPLLQWQIEWLKENGIQKVFFLTGHLSEVIESYFKDGHQWGVEIQYVIEKTPLGTAGALAQLENQIKNPFYIIYGDLFLNMDLHRINQYHEQTKGFGVLVVHPNDHPYDSDLVEINEDAKIISMLPKPRPAGYYRNLVNAAVYLFEPTVFKYLQNKIGQDLARDVFPELVQKETLYAYTTPEYLKDMGTPDRLEKVRNDVKIGKPQAWCLSQSRPTAFIDRDGVICKNVPFLDRIEDFELNDGAGEAIRKLNQAGWLTIVVTNQPMVAMGRLSHESLRAIHNKMETLLGEAGAWIDHIFYCPHHPEKGHAGEVESLKIICDCRKPELGMFNNATQIFNINRSKAVMIGDSWRDMIAGKNFGLKTYGVKGGEGFVDKKTQTQVDPDVICESLLDAVIKILN